MSPRSTISHSTRDTFHAQMTDVMNQCVDTVAKTIAAALGEACMTAQHVVPPCMPTAHRRLNTFVQRRGGDIPAAVWVLERAQLDHHHDHSQDFVLCGDGMTWQMHRARTVLTAIVNRHQFRVDLHSTNLFFIWTDHYKIVINTEAFKGWGDATVYKA